MSDSVWPHRWLPTRLPRPWDSQGKNTGVGCHFLLQCMKVKSESEVAQSCPTVATPWTAAYQAPPLWDFPGKSTGVGCHCLLLTLINYSTFMSWHSSVKICFFPFLPYLFFPLPPNFSNHFEYVSFSFDTTDWIVVIELSQISLIRVHKVNYRETGGSVVKKLPADVGVQEKQVWSLGWEDPLEEEMATHSSILAWRIPWTEEPGGLQSTG